MEEWVFGLVGYGQEGATGDTLRAPVYDFQPWQLVARSEGNVPMVKVFRIETL